jgi:hypothetical protein
MPDSRYLPTDDDQMPYLPGMLRDVVENIAGQAEILAAEMEIGTIADRGGAEALRLLAAMVRLSATPHLNVAGHG